MALTTLFTVHVPAPTHPDSLAIELDDPARPPIPLACQIDRKPNSRGIIVACHGMLDNRDKPLVAYLREASPWDIVTFDFRGMGESGGQTEFANHGKEADDIHAVVAHVERTYGRVVCVMGHSKVSLVDTALTRQKLELTPRRVVRAASRRISGPPDTQTNPPESADS